MILFLGVLHLPEDGAGDEDCEILGPSMRIFSVLQCSIGVPMSAHSEQVYKGIQTCWIRDSCKRRPQI